MKLDPINMTQAEARERLTTEGDDLNYQAAGAVIRNFGDGSLLEWPGVRKHLRQDGEHVRFWWRDLAKAVNDQDPELVYLSSTGRFALELACALATGQPIEQLGYRLCSFGAGNNRAVLDAFAIALHLSVVAADPDFR